MKKWLKRFGMLGLLLATVLVAGAFWSARDKQVVTRYTKNEDLPVIKAGWQGNPVDQKDRFINDEHPFLPKMTDLLKWKIGGNKLKEEKENDKERLEVKDPTEFLSAERDGILWLGHASFFIRLNGVSIITDPIFGKPPFVSRLVDAPSPLEKIQQVDYILLSHDHRDHADEETIRALTNKFPGAAILTGLRMDDILDEWKRPSNRLITAGWFQEFNTGDERARFFFLPVRHWSRRGLFDTNWRLWGGFIIQTDTTTIYFSGDSGYGRHYREVAEDFPKIDYFLIGIGAYEPRWFMEPNHNTPAEALKAFQDAGAKTLIPMHYGTFDLSDEPPNAPLKTLKREAESVGLLDKIHALTINESVDIR
jgi:L-ascorbate metabolism protein UlaG (beta-lactamase superfamily)